MKKFFYSSAFLLSSIVFADDDINIYLSCEAEKNKKYSHITENINKGYTRITRLIKISKSFKDKGLYQIVDTEHIVIYQNDAITNDGSITIRYEDNKGTRRPAEYEIGTNYRGACTDKYDWISPKPGSLRGESFYDCEGKSYSGFKVNRETLRYEHYGEMGLCSISTKAKNTEILKDSRTTLKAILDLEKQKKDKKKQEELEQVKRNKI